jgi:hypothetical protein
MREVSNLGHIEENGVLKIHKRSEFFQAVKIMGNEKYCKVEIVVRKIYSKRSNQQNSYYRGYIIPEFVKGFTDTTGEHITQEQAHEFLKGKFLTKEFTNKLTGEVENMVGSTKTLTTVEFMEYIAECSRFIGEWFNITILDPNEQAEMKFDGE